MLISALRKVILSSPVTVGTLVWLLSGVDLPVPVETAGVGQELSALLALHGRFPIWTDHVGPEERIVRNLIMTGVERLT